jgi:HEPN domain-containing protein
MEKENFDYQKSMDFWIEGADDDFDTMIAMYETKRYNWALFLGHLMIEKLLKAYYVKIKKNYPLKTHNLLKLANDCNIELNETKTLQLTTLTAFNINARYDDYKKTFYKKCTLEFTREWIDIIKELRIWIKKLLN